MKSNKDNVKALILAAGLGSRLVPITNNIPKALVPVNGKPILFKQIENLKNNGIIDITIVAGYKAKILERVVHEKYPDIKILNSVDYSTTNNMYSAYIGIKSMFPNGDLKAFYMMNADVYFDASVLTAMKNDKRENLVVVDVGRYIEESMKVIEKNGRLVAISKEIKRKDALGTSIDIYKFGESGGKAFFRRCIEYIEDRKDMKKWSEVALNDAFSDTVFHACVLNGRWLEIDNYEDLLAAEALFE